MAFSSQKPIGIALMDRSPLTLTGLSCFIGSLSVPNEIIVQETSMAAVSEGLLYQPVDILITELNGLNETAVQGREALLNLCAQLPALRVIVYTRCQKREDLGKLLDVANISVVSRGDALQLVGEFFSRVFNGERVLSPLIGSYLARADSDDVSSLYSLTRCENDVLTFLFNGMSLREIAELQHRSIKTISAHKCNAMRKLQVKNDSELFSLRKNITQQFACD
ncbi:MULTISPECIES: response regulator transcription factor [unclassified Serratia (in: enterobacteria)]|uniref:response regulator transcription factor n=1 Tax=unclassified Serratia (in: enterobacteria) TaxID=2647522 RepID=UPI00050429F0|nr:MULTISPECIES: response regulator transcription factor [unclassified Serratia (in: enterobacteria)]KFK93997.1 LuxR family transcriptional regulator [Serratia sp. Ag2]KFK97721.1 LuxR family transcriptional regulator [Serratia sp. Ag1]